MKITLKDYLTANGKYPNRENHEELTDQYIVNATSLVASVNKLLQLLGVESAKVSSGFRPLAANMRAGGAKKSNHMKCLAIDLEDADGNIARKCLANMALLKSCGLYLEDPRWTMKENKAGGYSGWTHLQSVATAKNPFIPTSGAPPTPHFL
jgi:hypothetical protein